MSVDELQAAAGSGEEAGARERVELNSRVNSRQGVWKDKSW